MGKFKLLIYDLDGTLVDTAEDITRSINFMLAEFDKPKRTRKEVAAFVGLGVFHLVQNVLGEDDPKRVEKAIKVYRGHYAKHMLDTSRLFPGAAEFLAHFRECKQAVITNKPNPFSRDLLAALGVAGYFFEIVGGDSVYPKKPDPASALALMTRVGARPEETVLIGDSVMDVQTARHAGIMSVCVSHGLADRQELIDAAPDVIVVCFSELLQLSSTQGW